MAHVIWLTISQKAKLWLINPSEPIKYNGQIRRGQIDALHEQVQVIDIDNGLLHQIPFGEIYCYPDNATKETSAIICMLPLYFVDGVDDLGQTERLNPDNLDSYVTVSNKKIKELAKFNCN